MANIEPNCKFYRYRLIKRNVVTITLSQPEAIVVHECYHPENTNSAGKQHVNSRPCDTSNPYCPYKDKQI